MAFILSKFILRPGAASTIPIRGSTILVCSLSSAIRDGTIIPNSPILINILNILFIWHLIWFQVVNTRHSQLGIRCPIFMNNVKLNQTSPSPLI